VKLSTRLESVRQVPPELELERSLGDDGLEELLLAEAPRALLQLEHSEAVLLGLERAQRGHLVLAQCGVVHLHHQHEALGVGLVVHIVRKSVVQHKRATVAQQLPLLSSPCSPCSPCSPRSPRGARLGDHAARACRGHAESRQRREQVVTLV